MKKCLIITVLAAMWMPGYGGTPKEYFEAPDGYITITEEWDSLYENDYAAYCRVVDSSRNEVKQYVYNEVLPALDTNSLDYVDVLLHLERFISDGEEKRALMHKVESIVADKEELSNLYLDALRREAMSWDISPTYIDIIHSYSSDSIDAVSALYARMINVCHKLYRPTDIYRYLWFVRDLGYLSYYRNHELDRDPEDGMIDFTPSSYCIAGVLWRDLARWDSISADEYTQLCSGSLLPFRVTTNPEYDDRWDYLSAASYFAYLSKSDYADIARSHEIITRRIYGLHSPEYAKAAAYYLEAMRASCRMDEAKALCEKMMQISRSKQNVFVDYEWWLLNDYKCRMSTLKGASKKLQKEIDKAAKAVEATRDTDLIEQYTELRTECALLMENYPYAIRIQQEMLNKMPALSQPADPYDYDAQMTYYLEAAKRLNPHIRLMQTYVLMGDYENAEREMAHVVDVVSRGYMDMPEDAMSIGEFMQRDYYNFSWWDGYPYRIALRKLYNQRILEHYGFRKEDDIY